MGRLSRQGGQSEGGQIGLFKATRDAVGEAWVVEPNRVVYERWEPNDPPGGAHAHTAAITTAGLVSHWGDVGYRNEIKLHALDLDAYTTAPVTTTTLFGGYDETANVYREAPQPVSAAPGMRPGEHLASGDLTREIVLQFSDVQNGSDRLGVDGLVDRPFSTSRGLTYEGALVLQLHWMQGVGYVSSSGLPNGFGHFSANGEDWVAFNHDEQADGRVYLYGDKLLGLADGDELHLAPLPAVEVVRPLALAPGGTNLIASSLQNRFAPDDGLSLREVEFSAGLWRYADGGTPLDVQPEAPPFPTNTPIYEAVSDSLTATSFGTWWLQEAGATADLSETYQLEHWVANLGDQSVQLLTRLQAPGLGGQPGPIRGHLAATTGRWVALDYRGEVPYDVSGRLAANLELTEPAPGSRFLVAWPFLGVADNLPYPLTPGASGTDESEAFGAFEPTERWTAAFVAAWPENASLNGRQSRVLLTLDGQGDRRVEITAEYGGKFRPDRVAVSVFAGDVRLARNVHDMQILRGEAIDIVVSGDGRSLRSTARAGSGQVTQHEAPYHRSLTITSVRWGGAGGRSAAIEPIVISVDPHAAASAAEQRDWMYGSLQHKAIAFASHAPGDYNGDGVMDAADYTVWQDQLGIAPATGDSADGNRDGRITMADYDLWAEAYGRVVAVGEANPSDHNGDGLINAADYTVWRDQVGTAPDAGNSADGNRDGRITEADYDLWRDAFGTVVPTLADVLGTPLSDPPSSTSSTSTESEVPAVSPLPESREQLAALAAPVTPPNPPRAAYQTPRRQAVRTAAESSRAEALLAATAGDATREAAFADLRDSTGIESPTLDPGDKAATSSLRSNEAIGQVGFPPRVLDSL